VSRRLAAYAVRVEEDRVLLALYAPRGVDAHWTLPGGGVEQGEDPFHAVIREVAEETGCAGLLG
jgi:8-oxo-dGTP diphosphatase